MGTPASPPPVERLVEEHYSSLYRYAFRLTGSGADAEDLTQEAFCKAQKSLGQLRDGASARPWLFSILRNAYLHRIRADRLQICVPLDAAGEIAGPPPEPQPHIEPEQLEAALNDLEDMYRLPLVMFYFEDHGYREIAEFLKVPLGTVMSRLARAKAHLRARLAPAADGVTASANGSNGRRSHDGV
jgi:RNA polymerase sigma-70 factor (ECF subfamily)